MTIWLYVPDSDGSCTRCRSGRNTVGTGITWPVISIGGNITPIWHSAVGFIYFECGIADAFTVINTPVIYSVILRIITAPVITVRTYCLSRITTTTSTTRDQTIA